MRFRNDASMQVTGVPAQGAANGRIEGPRGNRFVTDDATAPDNSKSLPRLARDCRRMLQRRHDDLRDLGHTITNRITAAQQDRQHALGIVQQRQQYGRGYATTAALDHAAAELERANEKLKECDDALAELQERAERTKALRQPLAAVLRAIDEGLRKTSKVTAAEPVAPRMRKGESASDAVARLREERAKAQARRARIETAPLPFAEAAPIAHAQLAEFVERGRPGLYAIAEAGVPVIQWPMTPLRVNLQGAMAMPAGDQAGHQVAGFGHGEMVDVVALLTWLFPDQMARRIDEELKACCADGEPLSREERAKRLVEIDAEILAIEREECAVIEAADFAIPYRSDTNWLAAIGVAVIAS